MRNSNSIYIDDLISISDFLEETQKDMPLINEDIEAINKLVTILVDGGLIPKDEFDEFIKSDPITNVYNTVYSGLVWSDIIQFLIIFLVMNCQMNFTS